MDKFKQLVNKYEYLRCNIDNKVLIVRNLDSDIIIIFGENDNLLDVVLFLENLNKKAKDELYYV